MTHDHPLRHSKAFGLVSVFLVLTAGALDSVVPPFGIPLALLSVWLVLRLTDTPWAALGLRRPAHWGRAIALGVAAALVLQSKAGLMVMPLLGWLDIPPPEAS